MTLKNAVLIVLKKWIIVGFILHGRVLKKKHWRWDDVSVEENEEDDDLIETDYCNENNELVKIFNQKSVICLEQDSNYVFRRCGHQCACEHCYQNKGDIDILKCVVCRT